MSDVCDHSCVLLASDFKVNTPPFMDLSMYQLPSTIHNGVQGIQVLVLSA